MSVSSFVYKTIDQQRDLVLAIEDDRVTEVAKDIAFYAAMIDAAIEDPLDDPDDQNEIMQHFNAKINARIATYQELVNENL